MQADRKMDPWMLRDLAQIARDHTWGKDTDWTRHLDGEAARREAEAAKPTRQVDFQWCENCRTVEACQIGGCNGGERQGPDSAAAPNDWLAKSIVASVVKDKPTPAADDFAHSLRSVTTVDHRWDAHALSIIRRYENDRHRAADAIDAANAEASSCAAAYKASEARVRELERECGQWQEASGQANVRAEQLEDKWDAEKARADGLAADVAELVAALEWYGEQARLARLIHSEGDAGRQAIASDGGKRARTLITKLTEGR